MKRAAVYVRVSTEDQAGEGTTSLDEQERKCQARAASEGYEVAAVFREEGFTGTSEHRPQWDRLMMAGAAGEFGAVVCLNKGRFSRDELAGALIQRELDDMGIVLLTIDTNVDRGTDDGKLIDHMLLGVYAHQRRSLLRTMAAGAHGKARSGRWPGGAQSAPFGLAVAGTGRAACLVLDEEEAATLRRAAELVLAGVPMTQVAATLNGEGRLPRGMVRKGGTVPTTWTAHGLRRRLASETLTGRVVWGGGRHSTGKYGEPVEIAAPAVLDRATWDAVGIAIRSHGPRPEQMAYALSGRIESECGETFTGIYRTQKGYRAYKCRGKRSGKACGCRWYRADELEARVWARIVAALGDEERLRQQAADYLAAGEGEDATQGDELATVAGKIAQAEKQLAGGLAALLQAGADPAAAVEATKQLGDSLAALRARRAAIERARADRAAAVAMMDTLAATAARFREGLITAGPQEQAQLAEILDVRVGADGEVSCLLGLLQDSQPWTGAGGETGAGLRIAA